VSTYVAYNEGGDHGPRLGGGPLTGASSPPPVTAGLVGSTRDRRDPTGPTLLSRTTTFKTWRQQRADHGYWPHSRALHAAPGTETDITDATGHAPSGVNSASQVSTPSLPRGQSRGNSLFWAPQHKTLRFRVPAAGDISDFTTLQLERAKRRWDRMVHERD